MKKIAITLTLILALAQVEAQHVGVQTAQQAAKQYIALYEPTVVAMPLQLHGALTSMAGDSLVYIFNIGDLGFILTGTDRQDAPIVGYSLNGCYDTALLPPSLMGFLDGYSQDLQMVRTTKSLPKEIAATRQEAAKEWSALLTGNAGYYAKKDLKAVSPLIQTHWSQGAGYNNYCPVYSNGDGGHSVTGCVATAMAQIIRYHSYPDTGFYHTSYGHSYHGTLSAQFDSSFYDYSNMPNYVGYYSPQVQQHAVSLLCYHCGVAVKMNYENPNHTSGSGAQSSDVPAGLRFFGYTNTHYLMKGPSTNGIWDSLLHHDLDRGRPIYYSGSNSEYGHAFVCDGYNNSGKYHFNFGWGDYGDGYFTLTNVNGFSSSQAMVYNIVPSKLKPFHGRFYVGPDTLGGGDSWSSTNANLEAAMSICGLYKQGEIWVKSGTYIGDTTTNIAFNMPVKTKIYGGFQGTESSLNDRVPQAAPSIMSGQGKRAVLKSSGLTQESKLFDMTIADGFATDGAAVTMERNLVLERCIIRNNTATAGAAINNTQGEIYCCKLYNNTGGAVTLNSGILKSSLIAHNDGFGVQADYSSFIDGSNIVCNSGVGVINNNTRIRDCVIWRNDSSLSDTNVKRVFFSAIEGFAETPDSNSNFGLSHYNRPGTGAGPFFKAPDTTLGPSDSLGDWHLSRPSALIDAGDTSRSGSYSYDLDYDYRIRNGRLDIGCYEYNKASDIRQPEAADNLRLFPNPASDRVTIEWPDANGETATLYNTLGQPLLQTRLNAISTTIDIQSLPQGLYLLRVNQQSIKFLKN